MNRAWLWFVLSCKRYVRRLSFLLILLILPLAVLGIRTAEEDGATEIRVSVYAEGSENAVLGGGTGGGAEKAAEELSLEQALVQRLISGMPAQDGSILTFYLCESEMQVREDVASKRAECGYVIAQDLRERLEKKDYKRSIRVYSAPSTVAAGLSTEVVFAALMELYDKELFVDYVENGGLFDEAAPKESLQREALIKQAGSLYETWLYNGSTFRFVAETVDRPAADAGYSDEGAPGSDQKGAAPEKDAVFPVRGIVAVYIFIIGLYAAVMNLTDEAKGLFLAVPYNCRMACRISAMAAPVFLAAVSGMAALLSGGAMTGWFQEMPVMLLYLAAVTGFAWFLRVVVKSPEVLCCLIPFFLIGSLLFCPVIIDVSRYFPALETVQKLFLPWYYLNYFG